MRERTSMGKILVSLGTLFWLVQLFGCAIGEAPQRIRPADTAWIQKGQTTRNEIVGKFGEPTFRGTREEVGQYAEYRWRPESMPALQPTPSGPFPQAYRPPARTTPEAEALGERFWVVYDEQGVVEDFGFGFPPKLSQPSLQ